MEKPRSVQKKRIAAAVVCVILLLCAGLFAIKMFYITGELSFDRSSGFYDAPFRLKIQGGGRIFYTLDGSEPDESSFRYFFPIKISDASLNPNVYSMLREISPHLVPEFAEAPGIYNSKDYHYDIPQGNIDKGTVVRAVRIDMHGNKSEIINAVYFVGMQDRPGFENIKIVSILSEPEQLFDETNGIYMMGQACIDRVKALQKENPGEVDRGIFTDANYMQKGKNYRVPALVYFWDENKELIQIESCKIGIQGHSGRHFPKKSFNVYSQNGATLKYCGLEFESLNLFSGSQDASTMTIDLMINTMIKDFQVASRHYTPVQVFLDGEYWGLYEMTERFDETYFSHYYGIDPDDIVMMKRSRGEELIELGKESDTALYDEVEKFAVTHDLRQKENFDKLFEMIDYDSFMDYYAIELYIANEDWPNDNFGIFRSRKSDGEGYNDGKFRYVLFDMNLASKGYYDKDVLDHALEHDAILRALWKNEEFVAAMEERIMFFSENVFYTDATDAFIDELKESMVDSMMKEYSRYYGTNRDIKDYRRSVNQVKSFMYMRYRFTHGTVGTIEHMED